MLHNDIKRVYQQLADAVNRRDLDALDAIYDPKLINHGADPDEPSGAYHFKRFFAIWWLPVLIYMWLSRTKLLKVIKSSYGGRTLARTQEPHS